MNGPSGPDNLNSNQSVLTDQCISFTKITQSVVLDGNVFLFPGSHFTLTLTGVSYQGSGGMLRKALSTRYDCRPSV